MYRHQMQCLQISHGTANYAIQDIFTDPQNLLYTLGINKSLARPTSRCRRTESIVSLERGVCSCAELQVLSCCVSCSGLVQRLKGSMSGDACHFNNIETRPVIKYLFPARQGAEGNARHSDRNIRGTCTIVCHRQKLDGPVSAW